MKDQALYRYFSTIADQSPFPVLLYNVPQFSGLELSPEVIGELAGHRNVAGMKESSGNLIYVQRVLLATQGHDFEVILGSADILGPALVLGIKAAILAVACALPELAVSLLADYREGKDIRQQQLRLLKVSRLLTAQYGVPGLKSAMDLVGFQGQFCRLPLLPLESAETSAIEEALRPLLDQHSIPKAGLAN